MTKKTKRRLFSQTKVSLDLSSQDGIEKLRYCLSLDSFFDQYEAFLKRFIAAHGLPIDDPVRLIAHKRTPETTLSLKKAGYDVSGEEKNLREESWSDELVAATDSLFYLSTSRNYVR